MTGKLLNSVFIGGFECSTHRRFDNRRLDLIAATGHDRNAARDYGQLADHGMRCARDGVRWHLIEAAPGIYEWSSLLPMVRAARSAGVQVIWDLCHYGYPDDIDIWSPGFVDRFARFCGRLAHVMREESDDVPLYCPVNEISFWAWAGAQVGEFNPLCRDRGPELKRQLACAGIAAVDAVRAVEPRARFVWAEPAIHIRTKFEGDPKSEAAERYRLAQYEAFDMLTGRLEPELGGREDILDIVGVNYYSFNEWYYEGGFIPLGHHHFRPFREMLSEIHRRYERPMMIAETGAEGSARAAWLHYVCGEVRAAIEGGVPIEGICLYPVVNYPGWENERICEVGLFEMSAGQGPRAVVADFAAELARQQEILSASPFAATTS